MAPNSKPPEDVLAKQVALSNKLTVLASIFDIVLHPWP